MMEYPATVTRMPPRPVKAISLRLTRVNHRRVPVKGISDREISTRLAINGEHGSS